MTLDQVLLSLLLSKIDLFCNGQLPCAHIWVDLEDHVFGKFVLVVDYRILLGGLVRGVDVVWDHSGEVLVDFDALPDPLQDVVSTEAHHDLPLRIALAEELVV